MKKWGDAFATVAQPVARGLDYVLGTDITNCSSCKDRQQRLNDFSDKIFDRFWSNRRKENKMPDEQELIEWQLVVAVKAVDIKSALEKLIEGKVLSVNPRPGVQFGGPQQVSPTGRGGQTVMRG